MGVSVGKLKDEFLQKIHIVEEDYLEACIKDIRMQQTEMVTKAQKSMRDCIKQLCVRYSTLQAQGETGSLRYIYISFLRTSILQQAAWYRMDAYDNRERASIIECGITWNFFDLPSLLHTGTELLKNEFKKQSLVREYEMDKIIYRMADQLRRETELLIPELLSHVLKEIGETLFGESQVDIMLGEYLDRAQWVTGWSHGRVISVDEHEEIEEAEDYV